MLQKVQGAAPFQVLTNAFSISPSNEGYDLQISSDGFNYSTLFSVGAGVTRMVTGVANGSYYRLLGNESEVIVNWNRSCGGGGSEGSGGTPYILPIASASELGGIKVGDGLAIDPSTGVLSVSGGSQGGDSQVLLPSSALPQSVIWTEYQDNTFKLLRQVVGNDSENYIVEWGDGKYAIVGASDNVLSYGSDWVENDGVYTFIGESGDSNLTSWSGDGKIYFKHTEDTLNFGFFGSDNPKEGGIETDGDENGSVRATTDGVYQLINDEWEKIGDSHILLPSSVLPQDVWVSYDDNQFDYVREDIINDGVYLMHWDDNNLYCGVEVAGGVITGSSYYMTEGQDGVWHSNKEGYENIIAWVEGGKIYWRNPYGNVSMLDAYELGTNKQGCSVEVDVENGTVRATTDGLFQYDGMEWKQIDNSLLNPVSELPSNSVDGAVYAKADYGIVQAQGTKAEDEWITLEDWSTTPFSQVRLPYAESAEFAIRYTYEGGPHQDVGFVWNGSTWDTGFNTGTITDGEWSGSENGMTGTCVHSGDYLIITFTGQPITWSWNWYNAEVNVPTEVTNYVNAVMSDAVVKI